MAALMQNGNALEYFLPLFLGRQTFLSHLEKGHKYPFETQFRLTDLPPQLINGKCSLQLCVHGRPSPLINI